MESTLLTLFLLPPYKTAANLLNSLIRCIAFFVNKHKIVDNSQVIHNLSITHKPHRGDWSAALPQGTVPTTTILFPLFHNQRLQPNSYFAPYRSTINFKDSPFSRSMFT